MTAVITHSVSAGGTVDATADVDGAAWDANHVITGVMDPAQGGTGVVNNAASTITISGSFGITFTVTATTSVTFPTSGTLATLAGSEALTNKTYNGNTWTAGTGTLTIAAGKTLTASNTLTFTGTDASSVAFGTGGTVAYTGSTLAQFAATTSAQLAGVISDETGSGALVFANSPALITPTGIVKGDVGLGNVDNTSDATKNAAAVTLTNKTIDGATLTGVLDAGGATSFEIPNDTGPTVNANGEIAVDTSVADFSHGLIKYYSGEELGVVAMPIAAFTTPTNGAVPTYNSTNDEFELTVPSGAGTVTSVAGGGVTITSAGTLPPSYGLVNHSLAVSAAGSALTIALKDSAGSDPSASSPVTGNFRSPTGTTGSWVQRSVTAATSLVISSGSTLGVTSSQAFRLWVVLFDDAGTMRLGVINCSNANNIFPLVEGVPTSSTAEGGAGAADSAGVFYTGTAVTGKSFLIVGYVEWSSSGLTAGTWTTSNLNYIQSFGPGVKKPGDVVQTTQFSSTSFKIVASTSFTVTNLTTTITPTSAANLIRATTTSTLDISTQAVVAYCQLMRGGSAVVGSVAQGYTTTGGETIVPLSSAGIDLPNSASSVTYAVYVKGSTTANITHIPGGTSGFIVLDELMG